MAMFVFFDLVTTLFFTASFFCLVVLVGFTFAATSFVFRADCLIYQQIDYDFCMHIHIISQQKSCDRLKRVNRLWLPIANFKIISFAVEKQPNRCTVVKLSINVTAIASHSTPSKQACINYCSGSILTQPSNEPTNNREDITPPLHTHTGHTHKCTCRLLQLVEKLHYTFLFFFVVSGGASFLRFLLVFATTGEGVTGSLSLEFFSEITKPQQTCLHI